MACWKVSEVDSPGFESVGGRKFEGRVPPPKGPAAQQLTVLLFSTCRRSRKPRISPNKYREESVRMRSLAVLAVALLGLAAIATAQNLRIVGLYSDSTCLQPYADGDMVGQAYRPIGTSDEVIKASNRNTANFAPLPWTYTFSTSTCYSAGAGATGVTNFPFTPRTAPTGGVAPTFTSGSTATNFLTVAAVLGQTTASQATACPGATAGGRDAVATCSAFHFFSFVNDNFRFQPETANVDKATASYNYVKLSCDRNLQMVFSHFADDKCTTIPSAVPLQKATMPMGCYKIGTVTLDTTVSVNGNTYPKTTEVASQDVYARVRCSSAANSASFSLTPATLAVAFFTILAIFVQRQL
eukprot:tig00000663_g2999.t1